MRAVQHFSHLFYIQFSLVYIHFIFCLTLNDFEWPEGMSLRKAYLTAHTVIHLHIDIKSKCEHILLYTRIYTEHIFNIKLKLLQTIAIKRKAPLDSETKI
jgi:hypothetical protein